ncbi:uncharacterized protein LOC143446468 isoform X3 [Clavelina lepadiformis]|uniref:uncharacterized protein LOC143446468 isoform X3 n=1 Tax=Clavelina lepadiformis TaxID=159417 RepID=UPI004042C9DD
MGRPRVVKNFSNLIDNNQGKLGEINSCYNSTFINHNFVPVKRSKPPLTPLPRPYPPMQTESTTKKAYVKPDQAVRQRMIIPVEKHVLSNDPLSDLTIYRKDFPPKSSVPVNIMMKTNHVVGSASAVGFDSQTTNKDFYKDWKPKRKQRFGELPAYTSPLIYPNKRNIPQNKDLYKSRTQTDFPFKSIPKPSLVKVTSGNIKVGEGDHDLVTTHQSDYQIVPFDKITTVPLKPSNIAKVLAHRKMELISKYQSDFPRRSTVLRPPHPKTPPPATLQIKMDDRSFFKTEQKDNFVGWDVNMHKRPDFSKIMDNTELSSEPMQATTTMMVDFAPQDVTLNPTHPTFRPRTKSTLAHTAFQDMTTNKSVYKQWETNHRQRFGDFHEAYKKLHLSPKMRSSSDFTTTTKSAFVAKHGRPRTSMKPPMNTIDTEQFHDFTTTAKSCYSFPPASAYEVEDFQINC